MKHLRHNFNHRNVKLRILLGFLVLTLSTPLFAKGLSSIVDRTHIEENESITLKVIFDAFKTQGQPDFSSLNGNFDVVSNNVSRQQSYVNGQVTASTEWRLVLFPKRTGELLIPPFSYEGYTSKPISIEVSKTQSQANTQVKPDIFLETHIDKTEVFVQEQALLTFKLHYSRNVSSLDAAEMSQPDLKIENLPRADYQKAIGQKTYGIAEFRYALIADASGTITIPAQTWTVETADQAQNRFFNGGRRKLHRVKTDPITLNVKPKPEDYPSDAVWLPASNLKIAEQWSRNPETFKIGEPITRTVTLEVTGAAAEQLPLIFPEQAPEGFKYYPDKPSMENQSSANGLNGTRSESVAIVPTRSGSLTLPEITVSWWDTANNKTQYATLPAVTVDVAAAAIDSNTSANTSPAILPPSEPQKTVVIEKSSPLWQIIAASSLLLNGILMVLLIYIVASRKSQTSTDNNHTEPNLNMAEAEKRVFKACNQQDPAALRQTLIDWANLRWPNEGVYGLNDVSRLAADENLSSQIARLNAQMFSSTGLSVDFNQVKAAVEAVPSTKNQRLKAQNLKPLYGA